MEYYEIRNWDEFQHYKHRSPTWIKLYNRITESEDWIMGDDAAKFAMLLCLLAASKKEGRVPADPEYLRRMMHLTQQPNIQGLLDSGFLIEESCEEENEQNASNVLSLCKQDAPHSVSVYKKNSRKEQILADSQEVLDYLNKCVGKKYRKTTEIEQCFKREGCTVADCKMVIDYKWNEWRDNPKMARHMNSVTPFRKAHFSQYLDEAQADQPPEMAKTLPEV